MNNNGSELAVITKAKDLCSYVVKITQKSPKQYRFTLVTRLQNLSLDVIENLYRANDTFVTKERMVSSADSILLSSSTVITLILMIRIHEKLLMNSSRKACSDLRNA